MALTFGQRNTGRAGAADVKERDIQERIILTQSDRMPFTSFMLALGSEKTHAAKFEHGEDDYISPLLTTTTSYDTTRPVTVAVSAGTAGRAIVGGQVWNKTTGNVFYVSAINLIANTVTLEHSTLGTAAAAIASGENLILVSEGREEGVNLADAVSTEPVLLYNYTQEFETAVQMSWKQMGTKDYTEKDWDFQVRKASAEQKEKLERMLFLGFRDLTTGAEGNRLYYSGGIREAIADTTYGWGAATATGDNGHTAITTVLTKGILDNWLSQMRVYGNPNRKVMFGSPFAWRVLNGLADSYTRYDRSEKTLGVTIKKVEILGNMIPFVENQQMARMGINDFLFCVDLDFVKLRHLEANGESGRVRWLTNVQERRKKGRHDVVHCDMGLMRKNYKAHGLLTGFTG